MSGRKGRSGRPRASIRPKMWARLLMTPPMSVWVVDRLQGTNGTRWVVSWSPDDGRRWDEPRKLLSPLPSPQLSFL